VAGKQQGKRPLLAMTLGVAACGGGFFSIPGLSEPPPEKNLQREIVVRARATDATLTEKVSTALQSDPYILTDHVTVTTENGVVRVGGVVRDLSDLFAILRTARRIAGSRRVVNEIDFQPVDDDGN
jgi:hypothetical protein